jgi:hypothetical protein
MSNNKASRRSTSFLGPCTRTLVAIVALTISTICQGADSVVTALNRILTKEQYEILKVDTMSADQRRALLEALRSAYSAGQVKAATESPPQRVAPAPVVPTGDVIESQVDGDFNGWEGETIVKLMNGQIWQQSEYHYEYYYAFMPDVLIYRSSGGYKMKIEGVDDAVGVKRLK